MSARERFVEGILAWLRLHEAHGTPICIRRGGA
jgi:hypothetical protein